jgi:hypothetical protein
VGLSSDNEEVKKLRQKRAKAAEKLDDLEKALQTDGMPPRKGLSMLIGTCMMPTVRQWKNFDVRACHA